MTQTSTHSITAQRGLTLVEIMVAITLSLVLLAGVLQIFMSTKSSYNLQNGIGRIQENARYASEILAQNIGVAGMFQQPNAIRPFGPFNNANVQENVTENDDLGMTTADGTASDVIEINYQSGIDCLGNATGGTAIDRYYIDGTDLMCLGNGSATPGVIAEGIENMQILYGEDTDAVEDGITNRYVNADNINWVNRDGNTVPDDTITSIRIALLVSSGSNISNIIDNNQYVLLNTPPIGPIGDNRFRRVITKTILLRNPYPQRLDKTS